MSIPTEYSDKSWNLNVIEPFSLGARCQVEIAVSNEGDPFKRDITLTKCNFHRRVTVARDISIEELTATLEFELNRLDLELENAKCICNPRPSATLQLPTR